MQYLRNAQSDFDPVFFYLFVFSSSVTYVKTEKMVFTPPPSSGLKRRTQIYADKYVHTCSTTWDRESGKNCNKRIRKLSRKGSDLFLFDLKFNIYEAF